LPEIAALSISLRKSRLIAGFPKKDFYRLTHCRDFLCLCTVAFSMESKNFETAFYNFGSLFSKLPPTKEQIRSYTRMFDIGP